MMSVRGNLTLFFSIFFVDLVDFRHPQRRIAILAHRQFRERLVLQFAIGELRQRQIRIFDPVAGFGSMVAFAALGIVVQRQAVLRNRQLPPMPVLPNDQPRPHLPAQLVPQPPHVDAARRSLALHADAAVAGSAAQLGFGRLVAAAIRGVEVRHFVDEVAVVVANPVIADEIA